MDVSQNYPMISHARIEHTKRVFIYEQKLMYHENETQNIQISVKDFKGKQFYILCCVYLVEIKVLKI